MHICLLLPIFTSVTIATCVTYKRNDTNAKTIFKNERRFPNGSVIGTYNYKDENGNPVYIKYYADDTSYGVELKSLKIIEDTEQSSKQDSLTNYNYNTVTNPDTLGSSDSMNETKFLVEDFYKNNSYDPYKFLNNYPNKKNKEQKFSDEYEIFLENILKPADKDKKEKVRIYVDKNRRNTRKTPQQYRHYNVI